jgi:antitoxin VapB
MINLSAKTEVLAKRLAEAQHLSVEETIRLALEEKARVAGVAPELVSARKRMSVEAMLALGAEIASMPLLDPRSPQEIVDDLNAL